MSAPNNKSNMCEELSRHLLLRTESTAEKNCDLVKISSMESTYKSEGEGNVLPG